MSNTKLKIKHNDQSEKRQHNKQPMGTQAHCPKRGKTRVTESVREVTHVVYFSLSLAPTDAFPPFFPMRKTDYFSFSALKNSTTRPALTPLCLRCIILCLECMFYSRFYFKSWALSFSFLLFSYEILVSFIRLSWKKVLYSCYPLKTLVKFNRKYNYSVDWIFVFRKETFLSAAESDAITELPKIQKRLAASLFKL